MKEEIGRRNSGCLNMAVLGFNFLEDIEKEKNQEKQKFGELIRNRKTTSMF
jgi:hypothetical protein